MDTSLVLTSIGVFLTIIMILVAILSQRLICHQVVT